MEVELLVISHCPGTAEASALLRTALDDIGLADYPFSVTVVDTDDMADAHGFAGSPAFMLDGRDLFGGGAEGGSIACRVYSTPEGPRNVPALGDLQRALREQIGLLNQQAERMSGGVRENE